MRGSWPRGLNRDRELAIVNFGVRKLRGVARRRVGPWFAARQPRRVEPPLSQWGLTIGSDGRLAADGLALRDLVDTYGSPLHVVSAAALTRNVEAAIAPFAAGRGADVFYSYKTNPVPGVLARMHRMGVGAEVISPYELWLALELGVPGDRIIYNGPAKSNASLRVAIESDVLLVNANSPGEVSAIARLASELGRTANLGVRVALPGMWAGQFGIRASSSQMLVSVRVAIDAPHVALRGLHFHRGVAIRDEQVMAAFVNDVLGFCDHVRAQTGWHPEILDLGGSLACPSVAPFPTLQFRYNRALATDLLPPDPSTCLRIGEASALAVGLVATHFSALGLEPPRVVLEPGRALTGNTQLLLTTVLDVKDDGEPWHAIVDAGINIAEPVTSEYHHLLSVSAPGDEPTRSYRLAGPICTPADVLYNNWRLPELAPGHVLAIMDTGAYCVAFSTSFSFPRPPIVLNEAGEIVVLRDGETFDDLCARDRVVRPTSDGPVG
jgi:diaminopimelate decarboxylase